MKRFIKVATLLIISLFLVVTGVDATLDQIARAPDQSRFSVYDSKGALIIAYTGDVRSFKPILHPGKIVQTEFIRRS